MDGIIIRTIYESDIPQALEISKKELGSDYLNRRDFEETLENDDIFCIVADSNDGLIGFCICRMFGPDEVDELLKLPDSKERDALLSVDRIGLIDSMSVREDAKGHGVGTAIISGCIDRFVSGNVDIICAVGWQSIDGTTNIDKALRRIGLEPSLRMVGYWNKFVESPEGHDCPVCGRPCHCSGVLYLKRID